MKPTKTKKLHHKHCRIVNPIFHLLLCDCFRLILSKVFVRLSIKKILQLGKKYAFVFYPPPFLGHNKISKNWRLKRMHSVKKLFFLNYLLVH